MGTDWDFGLTDCTVDKHGRLSTPVVTRDRAARRPHGFARHQGAGRDHGHAPVGQPPRDLQLVPLAAPEGGQIVRAGQDGGNPGHDRRGRQVDDDGEDVVEHRGLGDGQAEFTPGRDGRPRGGGGAVGALTGGAGRWS
ncbi:hypothetical protein [Streptomyces sp. NPDC057702]|uniref:hypothetical protein n=1 Tax=Streptomyces sp. NPDC057702 TaxID=3346221 RepID=UPI0036B01080